MHAPGIEHVAYTLLLLGVLFAVSGVIAFVAARTLGGSDVRKRKMIGSAVGAFCLLVSAVIIWLRLRSGA